MTLKRPGKIRFDYGKDSDLLVISNGKSLFVVDYGYNAQGPGTDVQGAYSSIGDADAFNVGLRAEIPLGNEAAKSRVGAAILQRVQRLLRVHVQALLQVQPSPVPHDHHHATSSPAPRLSFRA